MFCSDCALSQVSDSSVPMILVQQNPAINTRCARQINPKGRFCNNCPPETLHLGDGFEFLCDGSMQAVSPAKTVDGIRVGPDILCNSGL